MPIAVCSKCKYHELRPKPDLFSGSEMQAPAVLKAKLEWEQQQNERRQAEQQRFEAGGQFTYEPFNYAWCTAFTPLDVALLGVVEKAVIENKMAEAKAQAMEAWTRNQELLQKAKEGDEGAMQTLGEKGCATINPVTGEVSPVYALCARINPAGRCPMFEPRAAAKGGGS